MFQAFSIPASSFSLGLRQIPARARQLGFCGLVLNALANDGELTKLSSTGQRELRHLLAGENQQLTALQLDAGLKGFSPGADVDRVLDQLDRVLRTARDLGAGLVSLDVGPLPQPMSQPKPRPKISPEQAGIILIPDLIAPKNEESDATPPPDPLFVSQLESALMQLGALADRYAVRVAMRSELAGFASLSAVLSSVRCPWFGIELDTVAILRDAWDIDQIFSTFANHVQHVRLRDAQLGDNQRTRPTQIGKGEVDFPGLFSRLQQADFKGALTIDTTDLPERLNSAVAAMRILQN